MTGMRSVRWSLRQINKLNIKQNILRRRSVIPPFMGTPAFDTVPANEKFRFSYGSIAVHIVGLSEHDQSRVRQVASDIGVQAVIHSNLEAFLSSRHGEMGCAVCAFRYPTLSGFEFQQRMVESHPELPLIFVDRSPAIPDVVRAIRAGASNFLSNSWLQAEMRLAISEALAEGRERHARRIRRTDANGRFAQLDEIDAAVLDLLIQGCPNKTVAARLGIGLRTVERRRASALKTLKIGSLLEAVALKGQLEDDRTLSQEFAAISSKTTVKTAFSRNLPASR